MKFSVFTASTPSWTPSVAVETLASQGWDGIEWRLLDQPASDSGEPGFWAGNLATLPLSTIERDAAGIGSLVRDSGLAISGVAGYAKAAEHDDVDTVLRGTAAMGATQVRVAMPRTDSGEPYPTVFERTRDDLERAIAVATPLGVKVLIELHHETITPSASAARRLLEGLHPAHVGVIHDLGNLVIEGFERHTAAFELLGDYLAHIHVKNARWMTDGNRSASGALVWRHEWAPLRDGQADVGQYLTDLRAFGYDGWVTLEDFSTDLPLDERTRDNLAFLRSLVGGDA